MVGDTISVTGVTGIVKEVRLAYTLLSNEDEVEITIPNRHIIGEIIHNSHGDTLIELNVGISYHADPQQAIDIIKQSLEKLGINSGRSTPEIGIEDFADSNINIAVRLWAPTIEHHKIRYQANGCIYTALKNAHIEIAFPQREVRLLS